MKDEQYLLSVNAHNDKTFGHFAFSDKKFVDQDPIDYTLEDRVNFEKPYKTNIDYTAVLSNLKVGRVGKEKVAIGFKTQQRLNTSSLKLTEARP